MADQQQPEGWSLSDMVPLQVLISQPRVDTISDVVKEMTPPLGEANLDGFSGSSRESVVIDLDQLSTSASKRKRANPWSEEEHRLFLIGLKTLGKSHWKDISRKFVTTRSPTQVASHAQKYHVRQDLSKPKKRKSINDITLPSNLETLARSSMVVEPYNIINISDQLIHPLHGSYRAEHHHQTSPSSDVHHMFSLPPHGHQENKMGSCFNANYTPISPPWQNMNNVPFTYSDHQYYVGSSMIQPQFHPPMMTWPSFGAPYNQYSHQVPTFLDDPRFMVHGNRISAPPLLNGDHIDLAMLEGLLSPMQLDIDHMATVFPNPDLSGLHTVENTLSDMKIGGAPGEYSWPEEYWRDL